MDTITYNTVSREMVEKATKPISFLGRRSFAPRPLSDATLIFDDSDDEESTPQSLTPDNSSQTSLVLAEEVRTPRTAGLHGFDFHFETTQLKGPTGPHLFQPISDSKATEEDEVPLAMSPMVGMQQARPFSALNRAVAELDESQVRDWSPNQVAEWMAEAGFEASVVEKFLIHDIYGSVLLDLQFEDLKEIDISSFGKRRRVMTSIQRLRDSSMIAPESVPIIRPNSCDRTLARSALPQETHAYVQPSNSRRGRQAPRTDDVLPAESISIVAIEQILPEPHECARGEDCPKWQKHQRKIQRIKARFAAESSLASPTDDGKSTVTAPSVVASSDILGPGPLPVTAEALRDVQPRDPKETVRQFLNFQHVQSSQARNGPSPPPAPSASFASKSTQLESHLQSLPRLTIPMQHLRAESPDRTPMSAFRNPSQQQSASRAALLNDPYHYGGVASPVDVYRTGTPMSMTDMPVTAFPIDPVREREAAHSVPPEMKYGTFSAASDRTMRRCVSTAPEQQQRRRQPSFVPTVTPVVEVDDCPTARPVTSEMNLANHAGWMRKRQNTRFLKHEWQDNFYHLNAGQLDTYMDARMQGRTTDSIKVDDYTLHAYTQASSSKLHAAFKKTIGTTSSQEPKFAFSLLPEDSKNKKLFDKSKGHHFAVNGGRDRVEWMRKLMLAKAMRKGDTPCQI